MSDKARREKRWKREHRNNKGGGFKVACCMRCGHKLTRFGCPNCNSSLYSIGADMVRGGEIDPLEFALIAAIGGRTK